MGEKVIEKRRINEITKDGKDGFFVPKEIFHGDDCIIIISASDADEKSFEKIVSKAESNIFICYHHSGSEKKSRHQKAASIELNFVQHKSSKSRLFKSLNKSLDEVITYRTSNSRPKTMEEFLDEL